MDLKERYAGVYFPIFGISTVANYQVSHKSKLGVGTAFTYNGTVNAQLDIHDEYLDEVDVPFGDKLSLSIYLAYELVVNRLSLMLQPGIYVIRKSRTKRMLPYPFY